VAGKDKPMTVYYITENTKQYLEELISMKGRIRDRLDKLEDMIRLLEPQLNEMIKSEIIKALPFGIAKRRWQLMKRYDGLKEAAYDCIDELVKEGILSDKRGWIKLARPKEVMNPT